MQYHLENKEARGEGAEVPSALVQLCKAFNKGSANKLKEWGCLALTDEFLQLYSSKAATPGRVFPSIHSRKAPPAVEI